MNGKSGGGIFKKNSSTSGMECLHPCRGGKRDEIKKEKGRGESATDAQGSILFLGAEKRDAGPNGDSPSREPDKKKIGGGRRSSHGRGP